MKVRGAEKGSVGGGGGGRKQCKAVTHLEVLQFLSHIREVPYTQQSRGHRTTSTKCTSTGGTMH